MAARLYFLLCIIFMQYGQSLQKLRKLQRRLNYVEMMLGNMKVKTQIDISELRDSVSLLQNRSEEITPSVIEVLQQQEIRMIVISKAISDEKLYTRNRMDETKQINYSLTEELHKVKQTNIELREELQKVKKTTTKLIGELHEVESKLNKQIKENKEEMLDLRQMCMKTQPTIKESGSLTTTTESEQTTTTDPGPLPTTKPETPCPDGWMKFKSTCYLYEIRRLQWKVAQYRCADLGGILAEPDTEAKHRYLSQMIRSYDRVWLGGTYRQTWVWSSSRRNIVSSQWAPGEPTPNRYKTCLALYSGEWNDYYCTGGLPYICEKQAHTS